MQTIGMDIQRVKSQSKVDTIDWSLEFIANLTFQMTTMKFKSSVKPNLGKYKVFGFFFHTCVLLHGILLSSAMVSSGSHKIKPVCKGNKILTRTNLSLIENDCFYQKLQT